MRELSSGPEAHLFRTPGSPLAERILPCSLLNSRILPERSEGRMPCMSRTGNALRKTKPPLTRVGSMLLCTPGTGVNLWGESPLYENLIVYIAMDTNKSTSRRQGRLCEEGSEGSRSANVRDDEQKPHIRLSPWVSRHNTNEAHRFGGRVNAASLHGKFTFLSGEICVSRDRRFMRKIRRRSIRLTNDPAYSVAVDGYEFQQRETQNRQRLMSNPYSALHGNIQGKHTEVSRGHSTFPHSCGKGRPERRSE
jgi:hypothetical protein